MQAPTSLSFLAERHSIDLVQGGGTFQYLSECGLPQRNHPAGHRAIADLRQGTLGKNHFLYFIIQIQEFRDTFSSAIPRPVTRMTSFALIKRHVFIFLE